jgi:hypothetical protein
MPKTKPKENKLPRAPVENNKGESSGKGPKEGTIGHLRTLYPNHNERCKQCGHEFVYHVRRIRTKLCDYNSKSRRTCGCKEFVPIPKAVRAGKQRNDKARRAGKKKRKPSKQKLARCA